MHCKLITLIAIAIGMNAISVEAQRGESLIYSMNQNKIISLS